MDQLSEDGKQRLIVAGAILGGMVILTLTSPGQHARRRGADASDGEHGGHGEHGQHGEHDELGEHGEQRAIARPSLARKTNLAASATASVPVSSDQTAPLVRKASEWMRASARATEPLTQLLFASYAVGILGAMQDASLLGPSDAVLLASAHAQVAAKLKAAAVA